MTNLDVLSNIDYRKYKYVSDFCQAQPKPSPIRKVFIVIVTK